ncbi:MAG: hypothetical protein CSB34_06105 [Desulfobulbus propionicus]|nr:MAG: hypothetical protein CSB34_06105 [Desulfobulbus propionicus]
MSLKLGLRQMRIKGKIVEVDVSERNNKKTYHHQIVLPASDEYGSTNGIVVSADRLLGREQEIIEVTVEFSGYIQRVQYPDKQTGEMREFKRRNYFFTEVKQAA